MNRFEELAILSGAIKTEVGFNMTDSDLILFSENLILEISKNTLEPAGIFLNHESMCRYFKNYTKHSKNEF